MASTPGAGGSADVSSGADVPTVPGADGFEVEPEKLTEVADIISGQADALGEQARRELDALRIESPSTDIVSRHAVQGWNSVIVDGADSYYGRVQSYVDRLRGLAEQLRAAGAEYEASDHDKAAAITHAAAGN